MRILFKLPSLQTKPTCSITHSLQAKSTRIWYKDSSAKHTVTWNTFKKNDFGGNLLWTSERIRALNQTATLFLSAHSIQLNWLVPKCKYRQILFWQHRLLAHNKHLDTSHWHSSGGYGFPQWKGSHELSFISAKPKPAKGVSQCE